MEREILNKLIEMGVNRPIAAYRMIGNRRIEVHCLGDYEPQVYDLGGATGGALGAEPEEQPGTGGDQAVERANSPAPLRECCAKLALANVGDDTSFALSQLEAMTVKQLREIALELGKKIKGMKKAELIEAILGE